MWLVIGGSALAVGAFAVIFLVRRRSRRTAGPGFGDMSRDEQVQAMRQREAGGQHLGVRDSAKAHGSGGLGERYGPFG
jgi:hypothetical protein